MKNNSDSFRAKWQEQQQNLQTLLQQQDALVLEMLEELTKLQAISSAENTFFIEDDYMRIVVEMEAQRRLGNSWPCNWCSLTALSDALTPIVGWLVSPNSLWYALGKVKKYEKDIQRRVISLKNDRRLNCLL